MRKNKQTSYWVVLPTGEPLPATESDNSQSAMAKAMMMDVPHGCRVEEKSQTSAE
jgi:hypothetical protein